MKRNYSRIYLVEGEKYFGFRYNYLYSCLEYISRWDLQKDPLTGKYEEVVLSDWQVTDSIGLSLEEWKENPQYWVDSYHADLNEECSYLAQYI